MNGFFAIGTRWHEPVYVYTKNGHRRLKNWYRLDHKYGETENFTWGYYGAGPHELSYSLLRELFGKEIADREGDGLYCTLVSQLDKKKGFQISSTQITDILGVDRRGRTTRKRHPGFQDPEMSKKGMEVALSVGIAPGGMESGSVEEQYGLLGSWLRWLNG